MNTFNINIGVVGLGYVGLPLYLELNKKYNSAGFDLNKKRVSDLKNTMTTITIYKLLKIKI